MRALAFRNGAALDRDGAFPTAEIAALRRTGLLHAPFPSTVGGCDLGCTSHAPLLLRDILVTLGRGSLSLGRLYEGHVNAIKLVRLYGSAANLESLRSEADAGRLSAVWMAEDGVPLAIEQSAAGLQLRGRKVLASGAGHVHRPLVAAQWQGESVMLLASACAPERVDLSAWTPAGMMATATGTVDFDGLPVDPACLVGAPGDYMKPPYFRGGAWRVMAVQLGGLHALMEEYHRQICESGRQADRLQQMRFADAVAAFETARLWVREACRQSEDASLDPAAIDAYIDLMRNPFERTALEIIALAQKSLGLKALLRPNPAERIARDLGTYLRQPGLDASRDSAARFFLERPWFHGGRWSA